VGNTVRASNTDKKDVVSSRAVTPATSVALFDAAVENDDECGLSEEDSKRVFVAAPREMHCSNLGEQEYGRRPYTGYTFDLLVRYRDVCAAPDRY
jgi:hypothetical protein